MSPSLADVAMLLVRLNSSPMGGADVVNHVGHGSSEQDAQEAAAATGAPVGDEVRRGVRRASMRYVDDDDGGGGGGGGGMSGVMMAMPATMLMEKLCQ